MFGISFLDLDSETAFVSIDVVDAHVEEAGYRGCIKADDKVAEDGVVELFQLRHLVSDVGHDSVKIVVKHGLEGFSVFGVVLDFVDKGCHLFEHQRLEVCTSLGLIVLVSKGSDCLKPAFIQ